jgi:hypothetical protein
VIHNFRSYLRKRALGSTHDQALAECYGVEVADFAASIASLGLSLANPGAISAYPRVIKSDFFETMAGAPVSLTLPTVGQLTMPRDLDAIVGNPPYIRKESRTDAERLSILRVLGTQWSRREAAFPDFTGKADLWAFFVAHSHSMLKPGGRLALVLSWSLLGSTYGDAVCQFLARYYEIDAIIDSTVERFFAAAQNTLVLLARKAEPPSDVRTDEPNPNIDPDHKVRFIRMKQPIDRLTDQLAPRGKRAEDLVAEMLGGDATTDEIRWQVRLVPQSELWQIAEGSLDSDEDVDVDATG